MQIGIKSNFNLSINLFLKAFPFHLVLDRDLKVVQAGDVIQRICDNQVLSRGFQDNFKVVYPNIPLEFDKILKKSRSFFLLESLHRNFQLKGQMTYEQEQDVIFFLGSLWLKDIAEIHKIGVKLQDFAIHDPITDFLFLLQSQKSALADAAKSSEALKSNQLELRKTLDDLKVKNTNLTNVITQLNETQTQLVHSEKMAALGQLIAGIAHEINTPLGAIRSSVENISDFLQVNLNDLPSFFRDLSPQYQGDFLRLLSYGKTNKNLLSSKDKRKLKRQVARQLQAEGIEHPDSVADTLSDLNALHDVDTVLPMLKDSSGIHILNKAYTFSTLLSSSETIKIAVDRAEKVVFALKNYARHNAQDEKIEANIIDGIETVLTLYTNRLKHGIELVKKYAPLKPIRCCPDELNQVWTNLIHNALQAMENSGTLIIDVEQTPDHVNVHITDDGPGISQEVVSRIFEPFFTTKPPGEGTGMGLDIVNKIIQKHSGKISVESKPGCTKFTVSLPI